MGLPESVLDKAFGCTEQNAITSFEYSHQKEIMQHCFQRAFDTRALPRVCTESTERRGG